MSVFRATSIHRRYPTSSPATPPVKLLIYADDTLLFLWDVTDLQNVAIHLQNYSLASNAQINYHKARAISLSGRPIASYWMRALAQFDMTHIWTSDDDEAILYLGCPLTQCRRQREAFARQFLGMLRHTVELHSRRGISVLGL